MTDDTAVAHVEPGTPQRPHGLLVAGVRAALFTLAGVLLGLAVAAHVRVPIGPFSATLLVRPSSDGETAVRLAPLGTIRIDTHDAPIAIVATVDELRVDEAEAIARDPAVLEQFETEVVDDARSALRALALRSMLVAIIGGILGALASSMRWRSLVVGGIVSSAVVGGVLTATVVTWRPEALAEPRYTGLLTMAPRAVGDVEAVIERFGQYRAQLVELVENVITLYGVGGDLPTFDASKGTTRILHVSDVHLNPQAFDLMQQVVSQFGIDAVIDTGDTTDWGTEPGVRCSTKSADCACRTCGCVAITTRCASKKPSPHSRTPSCSTATRATSWDCGSGASETPGTHRTSRSRSARTSSEIRRRPPRPPWRQHCEPTSRRRSTSWLFTMRDLPPWPEASRR
jgi:hypothetical protein